MTGMRGMDRISRRPCGVWASPRRMVSRLRWCSVRRPTSRRRLPTQMRGTAISTMYFVTWTKTSPFSPCVLHKIMQKEPKWVHGHGENGWNRK